ncbi:MAG TPA: AMP-binding protein [Glaciibacter sp.]|nr:AMP-binding protein [Glaciibacter sp.]
MTRELRAVAVGEPLELLAALREALSGEGPAILPLPATENPPHDLEAVPIAVAVVIQTSGSMNAPKRVMLSANALLASAAASSGALGGPGQWLLALPAHYVAGVQVLVRSIAAETSPVVLPPGSFDPVTFTQYAEALTEPLRFTSLVPAQLSRLFDAATENPRVLAVLRRFTAILVGGQAVPPELVARAEDLAVTVVRTYGSSETSGGCVYNGQPIGNTKIRVDDAGELHLSGAVLAEGYLGNPVLTAERFVDVHGERWYRTGDLGEVDPATGEVRVLGRGDNVIISGGEKVSLDAVERVVRSLPGLADAVVVGVDDATWGTVPVVVIGRPADRSAVDEEGVLTHVRDAVAASLGKAARPSLVVIVPEIPLLASGKPDRMAVRSLASG